MNLRKKALGKRKFLRGKSKRDKGDHTIDGFIYPLTELLNASGCL